MLLDYENTEVIYVGPGPNFSAVICNLIPNPRAVGPWAWTAARTPGRKPAHL